MSTYYFNLKKQQQQHHISFMDVPPPPPPPPHPTTRRCSRAIFFFKFYLFVLMTLIASIITFSKKYLEKKMLPSTLDMVPSPSTAPVTGCSRDFVYPNLQSETQLSGPLVPLWKKPVYLINEGERKCRRLGFVPVKSS